MRILVTDGMSKDAVRELLERGYEVIEQHYTPQDLQKEIEDYDAVIIRSATKITKDIIDGALNTKRLKLIVRAGVGIDNIDSEYAKSKGIQVRNTPSASSLSVAELAIGHIFSLARHIYSANVTMRKGLWEKKKYSGTEICGKTLGLIGFGRIAKETGRLARALGMNVLYYTRSGKKQGYDEYEYALMEEILKCSDYISLHVPFDKQKGAMIGANQFEMMKDGVYLVNCARGGVVDEEALLNALDSGKVAAAALDVYENEPTKKERIYSHDKICLTPHIGASTKEAQIKIGIEIVDIVSSTFCSDDSSNEDVSIRTA